VSNGGNPNNGTWFVLAQGPVTLVMLNSELPVGPTSPQYAFLEATLSAVDRTVTPWVIVAFHRPMYYSGAFAVAAASTPARSLWRSQPGELE
jgi:hypothetical protein